MWWRVRVVRLGGGRHVNANNTCKVFSKKKKKDEGGVTVGSED